jgi:Icc-related predicted phosphoesterase
MKILYTTDLHGNDIYYDIIWKKAKKYNVDMVINGADMLPKTRPIAFLQDRFLNFLESEYFPRFEREGIHYACCLGNDDLRINDDHFNEICNQFEFVYNLALKKNEIGGLEFIGYNNVPDYPFGLKDRCRKDQSSFIFPRQLGAARVSVPGGWKEIEAWPAYAACLPTIEDELRDLPEPVNPLKTVYVIHAPPAGLQLDCCRAVDRPSSQAIYDFLLLKQPLLSLHGHIHNNYQVTGKWRGRIRDTWVIQPGQGGPAPAHVIIDTDTMEMERKQ